MKKFTTVITTLLLACLLTVAVSNLYAQQGPGGVPGDPSIGGTNDPVNHPGGGAPLGTGAGILISLAATYGAYRCFLSIRKIKKNQPVQSSE